MLTLGRGKGGLDGGSAPGDAAGQRSAGLQLLASGKPLLEHCLLHRCCGGEGSGRVRERCLPQPEEPPIATAARIAGGGHQAGGRETSRPHVGALPASARKQTWRGTSSQGRGGSHASP